MIASFCINTSQIYHGLTLIESLRCSHLGGQILGIWKELRGVYGQALSHSRADKPRSLPRRWWRAALPGGDAIGSRGLDFHTKGLIALGAEAHNEHGYIIASAANGLTGTQIELEFPSVGATENIMSAAVLASGVTTLENAAREPDIVDIGNFLIAMGADIQGLGTSTMTITGVRSLKGATHTAIPDRIVTGTWAFAAAMTLGSAPVVASDIRAGAGLVLAGLVSEGITYIEGGHHIDRGYPDFAQQLQRLGADVTRVD
ncbi:MAG: hypothetical protein EBV39_02050 [Actinobacteria bacterium]|nr:hypothetical protein [Actinomycetota bacterium]